MGVAVEFERTINATAPPVDDDAWARTVAGGEDGASEEAPLVQGASVGRYVIVGVLGEGGMGVVYAGYDPELDRRVALKVLFHGERSDEARLRTLREAQAMARLQHPNVVAVFDVGTTGERVWVAMEYVQGVTLRKWLTQRQRPWQQVLEVMLAAARGLAAAHAAGLVHRDVKPENIMIGEDGRVRMMDFGLARAGDAETETTSDAIDVSGPSLLGSELTHVGAVVGTPLYMAPEALVGDRSDHRADIFGWCVTCWEALFGERPFAGNTFDELRLNVGLGRRRPPPPGPGIPAALRRILERGLDVDPRRRHATVDELLAAIDAIARGRRRRALTYGLASLSLGAVAIAGGQEIHTREVAARCVAEGESAHAVWNDEAARRVEAAFIATGRADAADAFGRTRPWLDGYADTWARTRADLCVAAEEGAPQADEARACLDESLAGFEALIEGVLARADGSAVTRAVAAASRLPALDRCRDPAWLARAPRLPADPDLRRRISEVRLRLERSSSLERAGHYDEASAIARDALRDAEALAWGPLITEAKVNLGGVEVYRGDFKAAESLLEGAVWEAEAAGHDALVAEAAQDLTFLVGMNLGRPSDGIRWGRLGVAVLRRLGEDEALIATNVYAALAIVLETNGDLDEAFALKQKLLDLRQRHLGPNHPSVANALNMMGAIHLERGEYGASRDAHERALTIREATLGPRHVEVAASYVNLGLAHFALGNPAECVDLQRRALSIFDEVYGPDHPEPATPLENMATCELSRGDVDAAHDLYRQSLERRERTLGPAHPLVAVARNGLGDALRARGEWQAAGEAYAAALRVFEEALGADNPKLIVILLNLVRVREHDGDIAGARDLLGRADAIRRARSVSPALAATIDFERGRLLWEYSDADQRAEARALIEGALPLLKKGAHEMSAFDRAAIDAWVADKGLGGSSAAPPTAPAPPAPTPAEGP